jgi:ribose/xylose/arabinose/galactoside ABC-type transport system permease subunit
MDNKKFKIADISKNINFREFNILYITVVFWIIISLTNPNFASFSNFTGILREGSFLGITAIGMTFVIISGNLDLSVGSLIALLSVETIWLFKEIGPLALPVVVITGFVLGVLNGFLVAKVKIPSFIVTLGTLYIFRAAAFILWEYLTGGGKQPHTFNEDWFTIWGNGNFFGIPRPFVFFVILAIIGALILRATSFGRYVLAIGNSRNASVIAGIKIDNVKILVFGLIGIFTAISAFFISSRLYSANPRMLTGYEFRAIAAVVLGGTALAGGKGRIFNTFIASLFYVTINNALVLFRVDTIYIEVITGLILLLAFSFSRIGSFFERLLMKLRIKKQQE